MRCPPNLKADSISEIKQNCTLMDEMCHVSRGFSTNEHRQLQTEAAWEKPASEQSCQAGLGIVVREGSRMPRGVELTFWSVNSTAVTIDLTFFVLVPGSQNSLLIVT